MFGFEKELEVLNELSIKNKDGFAINKDFFASKNVGIFFTHSDWEESFNKDFVQLIYDASNQIGDGMRVIAVILDTIHVTKIRGVAPDIPLHERLSIRHDDWVFITEKKDVVKLIDSFNICSQPNFLVFNSHGSCASRKGYYELKAARSGCPADLLKIWNL